MPELKPTSYPDWATDDVILPVAGTNNKIEPRVIMQTQGADKGNFFGAEEANWILNSNGQWTRYLDQESQHLKDTNLREHHTLANMVADEFLEIGDYVRTLGYHTFGDTGGAIYKVSTAAGTVDGMTLIALDNGLRAEFVYVSNVFSPIQFGAIGNGVANDSIPMQKLLDLGEDNPSNNVLNKGIVIDLNTRNYAVEVTFQSKTTIKNGTLSQTVANVNILEHVGGSTKSDGWEYLHLKDVTFDGRGLGSGSTNTADGATSEDVISLGAGNTPIFIDIELTTSTINTYDFTVESCEFKNMYNSAMYFRWNNTLLPETTIFNPSWSFNNCKVGASTSLDPSTIALVFRSNAVPQIGTSIHKFSIDNTIIDITNAIMFSGAFCKVVFNSCKILTSINEARLFLGASNFDIIDSHVSLGIGFSGGLCFLASTAYNIRIEDSQINTTFDAIHVRSYSDQSSSCKLEVINSDIDTQMRVDKVDQGGGTRIGCKVYINNSRFSKGFAADPDHTLPNNSSTTSVNLSGLDQDSFIITGSTFGTYSPQVGGDYQTGCQLSLRQQYLETILSGNVIWVRGSDVMGYCSGMIYLGDPNPMVATFTGNVFKAVSGSSILASVIAAGFGSLDVDHRVGLAGNLVESFAHLMRNSVDGTTIPTDYNR